MKKTKKWILVNASILILFVIAIFIYVLKSYEYNLPEKKASPFVKRDLPPPRLPRLPGGNEIKFPGIAIIITNDRTVGINEDSTDLIDWDFLEIKLKDIYQFRADKSIRIIKEDKAFQEDFLIVMGIVKRLHLEVKEIINLEEGQVAIPENLMHAELDSNSPKLIHLASAKRPKMIKYVKPIYPPDIHPTRFVGVVIIEVLIDTKGYVKSARVISGDPFLNNAAIAAVKQWEYEPYKIDGKAVPAVFVVTANFAIQDQH